MPETETTKKGKFNRYIKCPHCADLFLYDYKDPSFKRDKVASSEMSKKEKYKIYNERYNTKKKKEKESNKKDETT